jgi:hypothetical protein
MNDTHMPTHVFTYTYMHVCRCCSAPRVMLHLRRAFYLAWAAFVLWGIDRAYCTPFVETLKLHAWWCVTKVCVSVCVQVIFTLPLSLSHTHTGTS